MSCRCLKCRYVSRYKQTPKYRLRGSKELPPALELVASRPTENCYEIGTLSRTLQSFSIRRGKNQSYRSHSKYSRSESYSARLLPNEVSLCLAACTRSA